MDIKSFVNVTSKLPSNVSVLVRGRHGIGKSEVVYQIADLVNLPTMERRLSQVTEGDMVGLPKIDGTSTKFLPPDWFMKCVEKPHLIFLDEINRATPEVMQAAFELVLDRRIQGVKVHDECRIFAAINASAEYQVNDMDPALLDRFFVVDLEPTVEDWIEWATDNVHPAVKDFILQNPKHLEHKDAAEPGKVYPSRRSWARISRSLSHTGLIDHPEDAAFFSIVAGFAGPEAAIQFVQFIKNFNTQVSAEDVLNRWSKIKGKVAKFPNDHHNALIEKLDEHNKANDWTQAQAENAANYMRILPHELVMSFWSKLSSNRAQFTNLKKVHPLVKDLILKVVNATQESEKK